MTRSGVIESASRLGVELNVIEAQKWIHEMAQEQAGGDIVVDVDTGVFGHRAWMLDLDPTDLKRFQQIAKIVGFENCEDVKSALVSMAPHSRIVAARPGSGADLLINVARTTSSDPVSFSVSDPAPATAGFAPNAPLTDTSSTTLHFDVPADAPSGVHPLTISADDGLPRRGVDRARDRRRYAHGRCQRRSPRVDVDGFVVLDE